MQTTMPVAKVRPILTSLAETMKPTDTIIVTQKGRATLAIMPYELYAQIEDKLNLLSNPDLERLLHRREETE